jgi:hypothetical protein
LCPETCNREASRRKMHPIPYDAKVGQPSMHDKLGYIHILE